MDILNPTYALSDMLRYAVALVIFISVIVAVVYSLW
jgi:hypothetical protein